MSFLIFCLMLYKGYFRKIQGHRPGETALRVTGAQKGLCRALGKCAPPPVFQGSRKPALGSLFLPGDPCVQNRCSGHLPPGTVEIQGHRPGTPERQEPITDNKNTYNHRQQDGKKKGKEITQMETKATWQKQNPALPSQKTAECQTLQKKKTQN